ncbi:TPA: hypothetical protein N0F65_002855, partial [Lagenidium giganteum]
MLDLGPSTQKLLHSATILESTTMSAEAVIKQHWIKPQADAEFPAEKNRYHLYVSLACPYACRTLMARKLKGLEDIIGVTVTHPVMQRTRPNDPNDTHTGWALVDPATTKTLPGPTGAGEYSSAGATPDTLNNARFVRDLYEMAYEGKTRYSVPVLWDSKKKTIVNNESAEIVRILNEGFNELVPGKIDLYPEALRAKIDEVNEWVGDAICTGVYKVGFATKQAAYEDAYDKLFAGLDRAEKLLSGQRYLVGNVFTEADIRLFVTLVRFDAAYYVIFKASKKHIYEYPNLNNYVRDIYQMPGIKETVNFDHIRDSYYASMLNLNPNGIVAKGPEVDFSLPHD